MACQLQNHPHLNASIITNCQEYYTYRLLFSFLKLAVAEIKFNNSLANASQLSEKLAKRTEELKAIQKQNILLNNQLAEARSQLVEVQAENKENY